MSKRSLIAGALALAALPAAAQDWPSKTITVIVPFAAGGPTDTVARLYTAVMSQHLGRQIVVENVGGAGGTIGVTKAAKSAPDGYTLLVGHMGTQAANVHLYKTLQFDSVKDFDAVANLANVPLVVLAKKDMPVTDFKSFIALNKANPDKLKHGHAGIGSASNLGGLLLNSAMGVNVTGVAYRGTGPAMNDLVAGVIDWMADQTTNAVPQIKGGTVKGLAVLTPQRNPALPDIPTAKEQGLDVEVVIWNAMFAPKGTPKPVIDKLWAAVKVARADATVKDRLAALGSDVGTEAEDGPDGLAKRLVDDIAKWGPVIKAAGVAVN